MTKPKYDYLIVGSGLYGAMFAHTATLQGKKCLVIEKNGHIGGFCYTENVHGIEVHKFGAHIFRTNSKKVWNFVNSICDFVPFVNSPIVCYQGKIYNLPFNMNTFNQLFGVTTPEAAFDAIEKDKVVFDNPSNLEEYCLSTVGKKIYETFIKAYTEKQWGKECKELPASIMRRIPVRYTFDNNYFNERYQGIPECGYTEFIRRLLIGSDVWTENDFFDDVEWFKSIAKEIIYTGQIDKFYDYKFGKLDYRSVKFKEIYLSDIDNQQGNAVVNFTDGDTPYTRMIEHKHFLKTQCKGTVISYETPCDYSENGSPCYPIPTEENLSKYSRYKDLADKEPNVIFGGRLAEYKYYSMNDIIEQFV
jgi:UDP-galactopyranose mutase